MAQVVMTDAQKDQLLADPNFAVQVKWSILDQANYTRGQDGTGITGAANLKSWAQMRPLCAQLIANPGMIDSTAASQFFVNQIASESLPCWDNVANTTTAAISWLITNNHFGANDLAQAWFAQQIYQSPW